MLIYEKIISNVRKLFVSTTGIPSENDEELTYRDTEGTEVELQDTDTYIDGGSSEGIQRIKRLPEDQQIDIYAGEYCIIGKIPDDEPDITPIKSISIKTSPTKTSYEVGDALDLTGLVITAINEDDESEDISWSADDHNGITASPMELNTEGTQTVTVTYERKTDTYDVTVVNPYLVSDALSVADNEYASTSYLKSVLFPKATSVGMNAFTACSNLETAEFPSLTTLQATQGYSGAFMRCSKLKSVDLGHATTIPPMAFQMCTDLTSVNAPNATSIGEIAFGGCTSLKNFSGINCPSVIEIKETAFQNCTGLTSLDFDWAASIGGSAFSGCTNITTIDCPNVTEIGSGASTLGGSSGKLKTAKLARATTIGDSVFMNYTKLEEVDLGSVTSFGGAVFKGCTALKSVIIRTNSVVTFGVSMFDNSSIASGTGFVYVPDDLVDSYKAASGWSDYAAQIKSLSELPVEA